MPADAVEALNSFNDVVGSSFFPRYLEPFAPERIVNVGPPPGRVARDPDVQRAAATASSRSAARTPAAAGVEGSGFLYAPGPGDDQRARGRRRRQARGAGRRPASSPADGRLLQPRHRRRRARRRRAPRAASCASTSDGEPAAGRRRCSATRRTARTTCRPARIRGEQRLRSPDIYGDGTVIREVFSLRGAGPARQLRRPAGVLGRPGARRGLRGVGHRRATPATR